MITILKPEKERRRELWSVVAVAVGTLAFLALLGVAGAGTFPF